MTLVSRLTSRTYVPMQLVPTCRDPEPERQERSTTETVGKCHKRGYAPFHRRAAHAIIFTIPANGEINILGSKVAGKG